MATSNKPSQAIYTTKKKFGTPVVRLGFDDAKPKTKTPIVSVDEQTAKYLESRKKRILDMANMSEVELATEQNRRDMAIARKEAERIDRTGEILEDDMPNESKLSEVAEIAATAVANGVSSEEAKSLATGKSKVIVVNQNKPQEITATPVTGGWSVLSGKPIKDPEGEYTFMQALKVAELDKKPVTETTSDLKELVNEIRSSNRERQEAIYREMSETNKAILEKLSKPPEDTSRVRSIPINEVPRRSPRVIRDTGNGAPEIIKLEDDDLYYVPRNDTEHNNIEMEKIKLERERLSLDKEHREKTRVILTDAVGSVIETGAAIASGMIGDKDSRSNVSQRSIKQNENIVYFRCETPDCGFDIPVPNGAKRVVCPKCGTSYTDNSKVKHDENNKYQESVIDTKDN